MADIKGLAAKVTATDTVLDDAEGSERYELNKALFVIESNFILWCCVYSCSCLEGNACQDPYTCKDWANRERIAAQVRKDKNLQLHYLSNS